MTNEEFIESIRLEGEVWKDVPEWEGLYMASSFGRIASLYKEINNCFVNKGVRHVPPRLLRPCKAGKTGYLKIIFSRKRDRRYYLVHRIIAITFIPNPDNKPMIDHIDRDKTNNRVENLRWCTLTENMRNPATVQHCRALNLGREYPKGWHPVVALKDGICVKKYESIKEATKDGFKSCAISNVCSGRGDTHYGYQWMYLEDYEKSISSSSSPE